MNKKRLAFSIIFSILFLCFVFIQVPFKEVIHVLVDANPFWLIVAITVLGLTITLTGIRWNQVLHALHLRLPFYRLLEPPGMAIFLIQSFWGQQQAMF